MGRTRGGRAGSPRGAVTRQHPVSGADRRLDGELGTGGQSAPVVTRFASHSGSRSPALVSLRIREFYATQAFYAPGDPLTLGAEIESSSRRDARAVLNVVRPDGVAEERRESIRLGQGVTVVDISVTVPTRALHGYLVDLVLEEDPGSRAVAAADVLRSWTD